MCNDSDFVKRAIVLIAAVIGTLYYSALDAFVGYAVPLLFFDFHYYC